MTWDIFWTTTNTILGLPIVQVAFIIIFALIARWLLIFVIRRVVTQIVSGVKKTQNVADTQALSVSPLSAVRTVQRTRTLGSVLTNIVNVLVVVVAVLLSVNAIDKSILSSFALLTAALGAGLGFGAQNIVKDVLNGLFMVMEDQLGVGDVVDLGPATGVVEAVGIRITQVRDVNGTLWFVRNGEILRVGNMSQGWARVIIDLAVPYKTDVDAVQAEMLRVAVEMATSSKWRSRVLEKPEVWGLESISDDALVIRIVIKTRTTAKDDVARELRMRLKKALDAMGVELPSLTSIVLTGFDGAASVQGARPPRTTPVPVIEAPAKKAPRRSRALKAAEAAAAAAAAAAVQVVHPPAQRAAKAKPAADLPETATVTNSSAPAEASAPARAARTSAARAAEAIVHGASHIPSMSRNQAPRAPRTVRLPATDPAATPTTAADGPVPATKPLTKPAAKPAGKTATPKADRSAGKPAAAMDGATPAAGATDD